MGFTCFFYEALLGFIGFYWILLGFTGFYWILLGFTRFYWVSMDFTGFYWALLGFTESPSTIFFVTEFYLVSGRDGRVVVFQSPRRFTVSFFVSKGAWLDVHS